MGAVSPRIAKDVMQALASGADGGPISVEVADIRHVLLAPIDRRSVMLRPVGQRLRAAAFALGLAGAVLGPTIGPCCYEFGSADLDRVAGRFGDRVQQ